MIQQFQIMLIDPRTGPKGGKAKPIVSIYCVCAETREEALEVFKEEMPRYITDNTVVSVTATDSRVCLAR